MYSMHKQRAYPMMLVPLLSENIRKVDTFSEPADETQERRWWAFRGACYFSTRQQLENNELRYCSIARHVAVLALAATQAGGRPRKLCRASGVGIEGTECGIANRVMAQPTDSTRLSQFMGAS